MTKKKKKKTANSLTSADAAHLPAATPNPPPAEPQQQLQVPSKAATAKPFTDEEKLRNWFFEMTPSQRQSVVAVVDKEFCELVLSMDQRINKSGNGLFYDVGGDTAEDFNILMPPRSRSSSLSNGSRQGRVDYRGTKTKRSRSSGQTTGQISFARPLRKNSRGSAKMTGMTGLRKGGPSNFFDDYFASNHYMGKVEQEEHFCFRSEDALTEAYLKSYVDVERAFHQAVRLCDTKEHLDTLTFACAFLSDPAVFLTAMVKVTRGGFLQQPLKMTFVKESKGWEFEEPAWFQRMGYYTMSTYIAHKVETALWMRYWRHFKLDPRRTPLSGSHSKASQHYPLDLPGATRFPDLISKQHLVDYLKCLTTVERNSLIVSLGRIVKEAVSSPENLESFSYPELIGILLEFTSPAHLRSLDTVEAFSPPALTSSNTSVSSIPSKAVAVRGVAVLATALKSTKNETEFVEFLYFSPLRRADTGMDIVIRRIGVFLQTAYASKLSQDLILGEDMAKAARQAKRKKKKSKRGKKPPQPVTMAVTLPAASAAAAAAAVPPVVVQVPQIAPILAVQHVVDPEPPVATKSHTSRRLKRSSTEGPSNAVVSSSASQHESHPAGTINISLPLVPAQRAFVRFKGVSHEAPELSKREPVNLKSTSYEAPDTTSRRRGNSSGAHQRASSGGPPSSSSVTSPTKTKSQPNSPRHTTITHQSKRSAVTFAPPSPPQSLAPMTTNTTPNWTFAAIAALGTNSTASHSVSPPAPSGTSNSAPSSEREKLRKSNPDTIKRAASTDESILTTLSQSTSPASATPTQPKSKTPELIRKRTQVRQPSSPLPPFAAGPAKSAPRAPVDHHLVDPEAKSHHSTATTALVNSRAGLTVSLELPASVVGASVKSPRSGPPSSPQKAAQLVFSAPSREMLPFLMHEDDISPRPDEVEFSQHFSASNHNRRADLLEPAGWQWQQPNRSISPPPRLANSTTTPAGSKATAAAAASPGGSSKRRRRSQDFEGANVEAQMNSRNVAVQHQPYGAPQFPARFWHNPSRPSIQAFNLPASTPGPTGGYGTRPVPIRSHHSSPGGSTVTSPAGSYSDSWSSVGHRWSPGSIYERPEVQGGFFPFHQRPMSDNNVKHVLSEKPDAIKEKLTKSIEEYVNRVDTIMAPKHVNYTTLLDDITNIVNSLWDGAKVVVYGSFSTNLCIPSSDVDIVIQQVQRPRRTRDPLQPQSPLRMLESALMRQTWVKPDTLISIESASVPVIKFITKLGDLPVDISIEDIQLYHGGLNGRMLIQQFMEEFPEVRPLALVLKQLLATSALNNAYQGGLSSYCLVLLIISFLQVYLYEPDGFTRKSVGELLMDFLEVFGIKFDFERVAINVVNRSHTLMHFDEYPGAMKPQPPPLMIFDPLIPNHFLGQQTFAMWQVKRVFRMGYTKVLEKFRAENAQEIKLEDVLAEIK